MFPKPFIGQLQTNDANTYVQNCQDISCPIPQSSKTFECSTEDEGWINAILNVTKGCFWNPDDGTKVCDSCSDPTQGCFIDNAEGHGAYFQVCDKTEFESNAICTDDETICQRDITCQRKN
jgi:hypothetical protein